MMKKKNNPSIKATENGPYIASEISNFQNSKGDCIKTSKIMVLCSWGKSGSKPFCDGTHWYIKFRHDESKIPLEKCQEDPVEE